MLSIAHVLGLGELGSLPFVGRVKGAGGWFCAGLRLEACTLLHPEHARLSGTLEAWRNGTRASNTGTECVCAKREVPLLVPMEMRLVWLLRPISLCFGGNGKACGV